MPTDALDLTDCDREPIHIPGAIQSHGLLFMLTGPELRIYAVSSNVADRIGQDPYGLLGTPFTDLVDAAGATILRDAAHESANGPKRLANLRLSGDRDTAWRALTQATADGILVEAKPIREDAALSPSECSTASTAPVAGCGPLTMHGHRHHPGRGGLCADRLRPREELPLRGELGR